MSRIIAARDPLAPEGLEKGGHPGSEAPPPTVLHIDDDANDTILLQAAARRANAVFELTNVPDGEHAIAYLSGTGSYADRRRFPMPALVLLDLKMPRLTGAEILKWIRNQPELGQLPVVVLSGSQLQDDMREAYARGANSYLVKPLGFESLVALVRDMESCWLAKKKRTDRFQIPPSALQTNPQMRLPRDQTES